VENTRIRHLLPLWDVLTTTTRPVVQLSLALNYALGGINPTGYHIFNVGGHILAALVLYGVLRLTLLSVPLRDRWSASAPWIAVLIASIWLVHPIQTESVTYVSQRGESLMGLFYLLTLYCAIRSSMSSRDMGWKAGAMASCLLGMAAKGGVMITAPLIVALYDRVFLSRSWRELVRRRWGLYTALAATWLVYPLLLANDRFEWQESAGFQYAGASPLQYAMTQPSVILHYLRLTFWPDQLCLDYGWPLAKAPGEVLPEIVGVGVLLAATVWASLYKPLFGFLGVWFFVILAPTSSFIPVQDVAFEHRMYLSLAAVVTLVVAGLLYVTQRRLRTAQVHVEISHCAAGLLIVLALAGVTVRRNSAYASELSIWNDAVNKSPNNPRAQYDLGVAFEHTDRLQEAIACYRKAVQESPGYVDALINLGHLLSVTGSAVEAIGYLREAVQIKPGLAEAHLHLGYALGQQGKIQDAVPHIEEALRIKPEYADAHNDLGVVLAMNGRIQDAVGQWEQALKLEPELADAHNNLAFGLSQLGKGQEAVAHYEQALRIKPGYAQAQISLARLLVTLGPGHGGDPVRAVSLAKQAFDLTGNLVAGYLDTLAVAYAAANRFDDAIRTAQNASELARSGGQPDLALDIERRLDLYRHKQAER